MTWDEARHWRVSFAARHSGGARAPPGTTIEFRQEPLLDEAYATTSSPEGVTYVDRTRGIHHGPVTLALARDGGLRSARA
jgi:hypothetical protein